MTFPATASILSAEVLATRVLSRYRLRGEITCRFFHRGVNDTYEVRAGRARYFLRVFRQGWRTRPEILSEIDMIDRLKRDGIPVSYALRRTDGKRLTRIGAPEGTRWAVLFSEAPGDTPEMTLSRSAEYGELVARVHQSVDTMRPDPRRFDLDLGHLLDEPLAHLVDHLRDRPGQVAFLRDVASILGERLDGLLPMEPPAYGGCHGDHHGSNVHVDHEGRWTLFDFDCGGYGWRAYDIAVFLWRLTLALGLKGKGRGRATRRWHAFLNGYQGVRRLTAEELEATRLFVPVRHIWLMGFHIEGAHRWGYAFLGGSYFERQIRFVRSWCRKEGLI